MIDVIIILVLVFFIIYFFYRKAVAFQNINPRLVILSILQSSILALGVGYFVWSSSKGGLQSYSDFVSGKVGFLFVNKTADYYGLFAGILSLFLSCYLLLSLNYVTKRHNFQNESLIQISLISLIPSAIMIGQWIKAESTVSLLFLSIFCIVLCQLIIIFLLMGVEKSLITIDQIDNVSMKMLLICFFSIFSTLGFMVFTNRLGFLGLIKEILVVWSVVTLVFLFILVVLKFSLQKILDRLFSFSQAGVPFLISVLASPPVILLDGSRTRFNYQPIFYILLILGFIYAFYDIFRHSILGGKSKLVSPMALASILIYLSMDMLSWPNISPDDFHAGEFYLPWWLLDKHRYFPFLDYQPARGLVNYFPGLFSRIFFDNTFSGQTMVTGLLFVFGVLIAFFIIRLWVNDFVAFLITLSLSSSLIFNFHIPFLGGFLLLGLDKFSRLTQLKKLWIVILFLPLLWLYEIPDGTAVVLGLLPLVGFFFFTAWKRNKRGLLLSIGLLIGLMIVVILFFPEIGKVWLFTVRYVLQQGSINDVAHGRPWQFTATKTTGLLWQFIRFSWVLLTIPLIYFLIPSIQEIKLHKKIVDSSRVFLLLALLIMIIALIPRSAGRIDPGSFSRPFNASMFLVITGLAIIVLPKCSTKTHKLTFMLLMSVILGIFGSHELKLDSMRQFPTQVIHQPSDTVSNTGLSETGDELVMDGEQISRQLSIKNVLDTLLLPHETFYDATNHNSDYGFQGRPSPVRDTAFYNIPASSQQINLVEQLREQKIPLALVSAENILFDGGTLPFRAFWVYKYLLENYIPFDDNSGFVWMIRKGEGTRLSGTMYHIGTSQYQIELLERAFGFPNLSGLPASWGGAVDSLMEKLNPPIDLMANGIDLSQENLEVDDSGRFIIYGPTPNFTLELPTIENGDFIYLETDRNTCQGTINLSWINQLSNNNQGNGYITFSNVSDKYLIPVSTSPSWYFASSMSEVKITFYPQAECHPRINKTQFFSRKLP